MIQPLDRAATQPVDQVGVREQLQARADVDGLIGGGPAAGKDGASGGTADTKASDTGLKDLNPGARKLLQQVRRDLELFYAATLGESGPAAITK